MCGIGIALEPDYSVVISTYAVMTSSSDPDRTSDRLWASAVIEFGARISAGRFFPNRQTVKRW